MMTTRTSLFILAFCLASAANAAQPIPRAKIPHQHIPHFRAGSNYSYSYSAPTYRYNWSSVYSVPPVGSSLPAIGSARLNWQSDGFYPRYYAPAPYYPYAPAWGYQSNWWFSW